jgi:hypothetical protein
MKDSLTTQALLLITSIKRVPRAVLNILQYLRSKILPEYKVPVYTAGSFIVFLVLVCLIFPPKGRIVPIGKEMGQAFELLQSSKTGQKLIHQAKRATRGHTIYLILGSTNENNLMDYGGKKVRGVTRTYFHAYTNVYIPNGIFIYTNKDVTSVDKNEIVKSIAFEMENVIYSMKSPAIDPTRDSPKASDTQKLVCMELGL